MKQLYENSFEEISENKMKSPSNKDSSVKNLPTSSDSSFSSRSSESSSIKSQGVGEQGLDIIVAVEPRPPEPAPTPELNEEMNLWFLF